MSKSIYAVLDKKTLCFGPLFLAVRDEEVERMVGDFVNSGEKNSMALHPEDFSVYCLGSYDESTGRIVGNDLPSVVADFVDFVDLEAKHE